ncbi:sulfur oxidation c-type cytochrome SoxA [Cupriavidus taiwanensis]|uniref:sulfur oxidation c-type cytochrome SoxA n=1 Tax=Cupriavidus taiwanensis TaxID=164546 RepID=UPI000E10587D|nr:sulfur oxidation c-type cytochrome SoxA [Cupriavidus taiwanensis]SOY52634.1 cytochrome of the thiosulfate-oxidizing multi-enzyme system, putative soxA homolog [Cupriavidus taiwanensis]SOY52797.1 cytochrome of the thiosulfate-oxidizing multi-enzyme system, putative soxA homolog [Cupriavidus taiwanensis]SOY85657.1 cytochrome of the thiosulfate-oxidizing multi-enzyme system, putative soxA homolog [Cupriavidus taiwanensis]SOZ60217.1 cytochrome of the thiosulfate-oxidizing multi-enzyme system, pu
MKPIRSLARRAALALAATAAAAAAAAVHAQGSTADEIAKYRQMLAEGNPAELWEAAGEELWKKPAGPKNASLEQCDLGKGPGVTKGAYAELPRYFKDTNKVMDLEQRLAHCRMTLQGLNREEATKNPFSSSGKPSEIERLVAYLTGESRGVKMNVQLSHPEEKRTYALGEKMFFYRGGAYDFACATCHAVDGQRIRLQDLPNLLTDKGAQAAYTTWPAYRVSQGEVRTMQHRLYDCLRQQRFPEPAYGSDVITALTMFLAKNANGGTYDGPAMKR